jgi:hypothetical protein
LDVRKIEYTEKIALILAESRNKVMLNNEILNMYLPRTIVIPDAVIPDGVTPVPDVVVPNVITPVTPPTKK